MNIYEKIQAIMKEVTYMQKDDMVAFGSTKYKALSEEKVTSIMHDMMVKHGLVVFPVEMTTGRMNNITHVDVTYKMVNVENPEEYILIASAGDGADTQDKGSGKAMTYAFKYMWLRTFAIPTGEDPDKISSAELDEAMSTITAAEAKIVKGLLESTDSDVNKFLAYYGVPSVEELNKSQYAKAVMQLKKKSK